MEGLSHQNKIFSYCGPEQCGSNYGETENDVLL